MIDWLLLRKKLLANRHGVSIPLALGGLAALGVLAAGSQFVAQMSLKQQLSKMSEVERFYAGELGALSSVIANFSVPNPTAGTFSSSLGNDFSGQATGGPGSSNARTLSYTADRDPGKSKLRRLKSLQTVIKGTSTARQFCGRVSLKEGEINLGNHDTCLSVPTCVSALPASCFVSEPVDQLFRSLYGRNPVGSENTFVEAVASGAKEISDLEGEFRSSVAYLSRAPATCTNAVGANYTYTASERKNAAENAEDVTALFRAFLGRFPTVAELAPYVRQLTGCPSSSNALAPVPLDTVVAAFRALPEFINAPNSGQLHAEPIRELFLMLLGRDPALTEFGNAVDLPGLRLWMGRLVGQAAPINTLVSLSPPFLYGGPISTLFTPGATPGGPMAALSHQEVETNPPPVRVVSGNPVPTGIAETAEYASLGGGDGVNLIALFRTLLNRVPAGPPPRTELTHYTAIMGAPYNAPLSYVASLIQLSPDFAQRRGAGCACPAVPPPICRFEVPKTVINTGETLAVQLHAFDNLKVESGTVRLGGPVTGWDGRSSGTITSVQWRGNRTLAPGAMTFTQNIVGSSTPGIMTETAVVAGPGGSTNCSLSIQVISPRQTCNLWQMKRGPGWGSPWQFGGAGDVNYGQGAYANGGNEGAKSQRFPGLWQVFIPARPASEFGWANNFRYGAGYWYNGSAAPVAQGNYQPCNRDYSRPGCPNGIPATPLPNKITYSGIDYRLTTRPSDGANVAFAAGGVCGSPDCYCYLSGVVSPLMIDFAGNGFALRSKGRFDLGQGPGEYFWPEAGRDFGFLVLEKNGRVTNYNQLFGSPTIGPDGKTAPHGFAALRKYDLNQDSLINSQDEIYGQLKVWFDENGDSISQPEERMTLRDLDIEYIDLYHLDVDERVDNFGNVIRQRSHARLKDGTALAVADVWIGLIR